MLFRQMSESVDISVADGRVCYCKSCRRDDAAVDGADEIFMVGAQGGCKTFIFGIIQKIILDGEAG